MNWDLWILRQKDCSFAGLAHSPKMIDEIFLRQSCRCACRNDFIKDPFGSGAQVSIVNQNKCISCMTCVNACPYGAPYFNYNHKAEIERAKWWVAVYVQAECPARANSNWIILKSNHSSNDRQLFTVEESASWWTIRHSNLKLLPFAAIYCAYASADLGRFDAVAISIGVRIIRSPCTGRLENRILYESIWKRRRRCFGCRLSWRRLSFYRGKPVS